MLRHQEEVAQLGRVRANRGSPRTRRICETLSRFDRDATQRFAGADLADTRRLAGLQVDFVELGGGVLCRAKYREGGVVQVGDVEVGVGQSGDAERTHGVELAQIGRYDGLFALDRALAHQCAGGGVDRVVGGDLLVVLVVGVAGSQHPRRHLLVCVAGGVMQRAVRLQARCIGRGVDQRAGVRVGAQVLPRVRHDAYAVGCRIEVEAELPAVQRLREFLVAHRRQLAARGVDPEHAPAAAERVQLAAGDPVVDAEHCFAVSVRPPPSSFR